jgi:hypothetical protein
MEPGAALLLRLRLDRMKMRPPGNPSAPAARFQELQVRAFFAGRRGGLYWR